jgi:hypothetical protein
MKTMNDLERDLLAINEHILTRNHEGRVTGVNHVEYTKAVLTLVNNLMEQPRV